MLKYLSILVFLIPSLSFSQGYQQPDAARLKLKLKKLNFLGSVLYVAAHPDDENTRIITYLSNDKLASTAYLSLTRGDGGQNLIGPEIRDLLGLIRTQELLAARRIDGGQQFFTRANDFGFSKSADEAFQIWGKDEVLSDVVKMFRQYQPDVIITRFPPDARAGHGHHTASSMLANEAFDVAAQPDRYPEQVSQFGTWQVKRLYTNTGRWWNRDINENTPGVITLNVGGYNTLLGKSYTEIAALSSSQHKSQGWGQAGVRGDQQEFLEYMKGEKAGKDIFEGVNTTWTRVKGGENIAPLVEKAIQQFNPENPSASIPPLLQIRKSILSLENSVWKTRKLHETEQLILDCMGLFIEITASHYHVSGKEKFKSTIEIVNRSAVPVEISRMSATALGWDTTFSAPVKNNIKLQIKSTVSVTENIPYSDPYWLQQPHGTGLFTVKNKEQIGLPENLPAIEYNFQMTVAGESIQVKRPLIYKWVDDVKGELWRPVEVVPPVFVNLSDKVLIFNDQQPEEMKVVLRSSSAGKISGTLKFELPKGWRTEPASSAFELQRQDEEISRTFLVYPSSEESSGVIKAVAECNGKSYDQSLVLVSYDHFPIQTLLPKAQAKVVRMDLKKEGKSIAYIKGAGDEVPSALRHMGYDVWEMKNEEVTSENLKKVDAVVLGVRALNTNDRIRYFMTDLLEFVKNGGTMVVQYNTNFDMKIETFSPYLIKLSRDRVTQEDAPVTLLKPEHPLLNYPNKISLQNFEGWVQERGLYFPTEWDPAFEALLLMNDKGEQAKNGSLLVAKYGNGHYIYTGLSFFRELPEGIPGAYKLFANMVSYGQSSKPEASRSKQKTK